MGAELKTGFTGLVTNTADLQAPPGGCERCENVVIRRTGACEVRPGLLEFAETAAPDTILKIIPYELLTLLAIAGDQWWDVENDVALLLPDPVGGPDVSPAFFREDLIPHAQARGNLYLGTQQGVVKWTGGDSFLIVGVPPLLSFTVVVNGVANGPIPANSQVAYSVVIRHTDPNGLIVRSQPTGAILAINATAGPAAAFITIETPMVPPTVVAGDVYEVYRTRTFPLTVPPDAEMQLVAEVPAATSVGLIDLCPQSARGAVLYTSPSRAGAAGANYLPPACGALAVFKGALFCGNVIGPVNRVMSMNISAVDLVGQAAGIGFRSVNADFTLGSPILTNVIPSTAGIQPGMTMHNLPWHVVAVTATTITISEPSTFSSTTNLVRFHDAISLDGGVTWRSIYSFATSGSLAFPEVPAWLQRVTPPIGGYNTTAIATTYLRGPDAELLINATHGNEYSLPLPLYGEPSDEGEQDVMPDGLFWSPPDEPDHFPPANFARVGDAKRAILALCATRDALFIFKEDGTWRLTGIPGQYRIDPFDLTAACCLPSSVQGLENKIYVLTTKGICAVSDRGVEIVSMPIADQLEQLVLDVVGGSVGGTLPYFIPSLAGYAGSADPVNNEYRLMVGDALVGQASQIQKSGVLVWNDDTKTWVSWSFNDGGTFGRRFSTIAYLDRRAVTVFGERSVDDSPVGLYNLAWPSEISILGGRYACDWLEEFEILTVAGVTITYTPAIEMIPGDVVVAAGSVPGGLLYLTVVAVNSDTSVDLSGPVEFTGDAAYVRPILCVVRPRPFTKPHHTMKQWTHATAEFSRMVGAVYGHLAALSSVNVNATNIEDDQTPLDLATVGGQALYELGGAIRAILPTRAARGWLLKAEFSWAQVRESTALEAIWVETMDGKANVPNLAVRVGP